jgi:hypothetical protein
MEPACDFCGEPLEAGESWRFVCEDFELKKSASRSQVYEDDWSACPTCKDLIVAGKRDALAKRSARLTSARIGIPAPFAAAEQSAREIQDGFWSQRTGPPTLETAEEFGRAVKPPRYEIDDGTG